MTAPGRRSRYHSGGMSLAGIGVTRNACAAPWVSVTDTSTSAAAPVAEARRQLRRQQQVIVVRRSIEQHQRAGVARGVECVKRLRVALEKIILALVAPDDELEMRVWALVAADLEQHDVVKFVLLVNRAWTRDQRLAILFVGEEAAAAGGWA